MWLSCQGSSRVKRFMCFLAYHLNDGTSGILHTEFATVSNAEALSSWGVGRLTEVKEQLAEASTQLAEAKQQLAESSMQQSEAEQQLAEARKQVGISISVLALAPSINLIPLTSYLPGALAHCLPYKAGLQSVLKRGSQSIL